MRLVVANGEMTEEIALTIHAGATKGSVAVRQRMRSVPPSDTPADSVRKSSILRLDGTIGTREEALGPPNEP